MAALAMGPSFAEKTGTSRPKLATPPALEACDASELDFAIGKLLDDGLKARALEASGANSVRVFHSGEPITEDLRSDRLNLELSPQDKIIKAGCF
jgi:hypothetical protein